MKRDLNGSCLDTIQSYYELHLEWRASPPADNVRDITSRWRIEMQKFFVRDKGELYQTWCTADVQFNAVRQATTRSLLATGNE